MADYLNTSQYWGGSYWADSYWGSVVVVYISTATPTCRIYTVDNSTYTLALTLYGSGKYGAIIYGNIEAPTERLCVIGAESRTYEVESRTQAIALTLYGSGNYGAITYSTIYVPTERTYTVPFCTDTIGGN